jgi:hypothetical protein
VRLRVPTKIRVLVAVAVLAAAALPAAAEAANPAEVFRAAKQAWKESPEARLAFKLTRRVGTASVKQWRKSDGQFCPWRAYSPSYCRNGIVVATVDLDFSVTVAGERVVTGRVARGAWLSAACQDVTRIRVLWPTPAVPSAYVSFLYVDPLLGTSFNLPPC